MFIWVTLPEYLDAAALLKRSLEEEGIAFVPGQSFFATGERANYLRLNYTLASKADVRDGIYRLGRLIYRELASNQAERAGVGNVW
jgi:DNA-binding transcriptional MocR family regulator